MTSESDNDAQLQEASKCRIQLEKNFLDIMKNVRPDAISDYLYQEGVLDTDQLRLLTDDKESELKRTRALFDALYNMPPGLLPSAFNHFISALECVVDWLAVQIVFTEVSEDELKQEMQRYSDVFKLAKDEPPKKFRGTNTVSANNTLHVAASPGHDSVSGLSGSVSDVLSTTYTASILLYRVIRSKLTDALSSQASQPAATSQPGSSDVSAIRNISFRSLFNEYAPSVGISTRQTQLNVNRVANTLIRLGDEFERTYGNQINELVDRADEERLDESTNWFGDVATAMLATSISWGRIVSLFVFSARFVLRLASKAVSSVARLIGTTVFRFANIIGKHVSSWIVESGGWAAMEDETVVSSVQASIQTDNENFRAQQLQTFPNQTFHAPTVYHNTDLAFNVVKLLYSLYRST